MTSKDICDCPPHLQLGRAGENAAQAILQNRGYTILARNWRFGHLELDLVCELGDLIVFVEVKTRKGSGYGGARGAITKAKKKKILMAAQAWLQQNNISSRPCRFDVICLTGKETFFMEHYQNAFSNSLPLDGGHASGQYW